MSLIKKLWFEEGLYPDEDYDFLDIDETELGNFDFFDLDEDHSVIGDDDGVFNFGDIDEGDETAEGDYDMNEDTPPPPDPTDISHDFMDEDEWYEEHKNEEAKSIDFTDEDEWYEENADPGYCNYDFGDIDPVHEPPDLPSYIVDIPCDEDRVDDYKYNFEDLDAGAVDYNFLDIDEDIYQEFPDDGVCNFGDIDEEDETAVGNWDFVDIDDPNQPTNAIDDTSYDFYDIDEDPPVEGDDDGVFNFGDIQIFDCTAVGNWDFDPEEEYEPSVATEDYDFNIIEGEIPDEPDDGVYNFGDIDEGDETADGDYDMMSQDQPHSPGDTEPHAEGDYDMMMDPPENVRPEDPDNGKFDWGELETSETDVSFDFVDEDEYYESVEDFGWENYNFYNIDLEEEDIDLSYQTVPGTATDPDDGVYNFGDLDEEDESAVGDYDMDDNPPQEQRPDEPDDGYYNFGDIDEEPAPEKDRTAETEEDAEWPENREYGDADVEEEAGEEYANIGTARGDWDMMENPIAERHPLDIDEGEFNFGDIDEGDETAEGDYDYGDAEDDEEYKFDFHDMDEIELWPTQFDVDYDFGELDLIGFQQTKDFLIKAFQEVIADMTKDPDFEVYEKDIETGLDPYMKFQYWYNERTNKSFIQYEFFNQNHNQILNKHDLMDRVTARIKAQFKYDTGIIPEIVNISEKDVVPDNRRVITPYIIGYWESLNGGYETIEDRAEIALDMRQFTDPDYVTDEAAYDLGDYFKHRSKKFIEFYNITNRISNDYNLKIKSLSTADQDAYIQEYHEVLKHRNDANFPDLVAELNERYSNNNYTNSNIPDAFNEYWDEYKDFFNYKLPSVYYYTRRCNVVIKNIA